MAIKKKAPRRILVLDVGGSHVKFRVGDRGEEQKFASGPKLTAAAMVKKLRKLIDRSDYDAVSIGYPGPVSNGRPALEPKNLGAGWVRFDYDKAFSKPVRVVNDAAMQALGAYQGGRMLFLGLGTGLGSAFVANGQLEPLELAHLPYRNNRTYEDYVGLRGYERLGRKKWQKHVEKVIELLKHGLQADYVMLGGGQTKKLKELPPGVRLGDNSHAILGGIRLWDTTVSEATNPATTKPPASASGKAAPSRA